MCLCIELCIGCGVCFAVPGSKGEKGEAGSVSQWVVILVTLVVLGHQGIKEKKECMGPKASQGLTA